MKFKQIVTVGMILLSLESCQAQEPNGKAQEILTDKQHSLPDSSAINIPLPIQSLMKYYDAIVGFENNHILFADGSTMIYDDGKTNKSLTELLNNPDIEDQFYYKYPKGKLDHKMAKGENPGRIRNETFFKQIYGTSAKNVSAQLEEITWCPQLVNQKIRVTKVNGVAEKVKLISKELDEMPQFRNYIQNIGGTFNWRNISGTNRLSMHSFGMTIDINTAHSNYWQWDCKCTNETVDLRYKNKIPPEIVAVFEKYGFIWGGRWYNYDTMHFEYRPELLD